MKMINIGIIGEVDMENLCKILPAGEGLTYAVYTASNTPIVDKNVADLRGIAVGDESSRHVGASGVECCEEMKVCSGASGVECCEEAALSVTVSQLKMIKVGGIDCDINLHTVDENCTNEYIVSVCDIVVSTDFCEVAAEIADRRKIMYITGGVAVVNLQEYVLSHKLIADYVDKLYTFNEELPVTKSPWWKGVYGKFFKKYKRKIKSETFNEDLDTNSAIYKKFENYDNRANKYNAIYRSSLYLRGLLPMFATLLLSVALNITSIGKFIFGGEYWGLVSGLFFMGQAIFNYLIIALSDYVAKRYIIQNFMRARYMAESLRLIMLSAPNALPRGTSSRILFTDIDGSIAREGRRAEAIYKENLSQQFDYNSENVTKIAENLRAVSGNQLGYHTANSANCKRAADNLTRIAKIMFWVAMGVVLGRAIYQIVVQFVAIPGGLNGVTTHNFLLVSLNFAATLIPSFTAMYTGLKTSLNIDNNYARSFVMKDMLGQFNTAIDSALESSMNYSRLNRFYAKLSNILMEETLDWHTATEQKKVSRM